MRRTRYLLAAVLVVILSTTPLSGWPLGRASVYAETSAGRGQSQVGVQAADPVGVRSVAASNENERRDQDNRRQRGNNDNSDDNDNHDNSNDNVDHSGDIPSPPQQITVPSQIVVPDVAASSDQVMRCLQGGEAATLLGLDGGIVVTVFQNDVSVQLARVDPSSVPSPGRLVGRLMFRLGASTCAGAPYTALPGEANLGITYTLGAPLTIGGVLGRNEGSFAMMYYDGQRWANAPKQAVDPQHNYVSATVTGLGIYALIQQ